jgi:hypothetical protein
VTDVCIDHGMGLDGCRPVWRPGDASKEWLLPALFQALNPVRRQSFLAGVIDEVVARPSNAAAGPRELVARPRAILPDLFLRAYWEVDRDVNE